MGEEKAKPAKELSKELKFRISKKPLIVGGIIATIAIAGIVTGIYFWSKLLPTRHELVVGVYERWPVVSIDPFNSFLLEWGMINQIAETLFEYDYSEGEPQIIPNLAIDSFWSPNATELICILRQGVKFHDGTPFNAEAVQWNWNRIHQVMNISGMRYLFEFLDGRRIVNKTQVIDEYTIKFVLNAPYAPFRALLTEYQTSILSPASTPSDELFTLEDSVLVGTGPFIFDEFEPAIKLTMNPNLNYWGGKPKVDKLIFSFYSNHDDIWDAMLVKNVSMIDPLTFWGYYDPQYPNGTIDNFRNNPEFKVQEELGKFFSFIGMNNSFINVTMRKAISYAINYTHIIEKIAQNCSVRSKSCIPDYILYCNTTAFNIPYYNISKARQVLIDEGWPGTTGLTANDNITADNEWEMLATNGPPIATYNITYFHWDPGSVQSANLVYENLKQIGVNISRVGYYEPYPSEAIYILGFFMDFNDPSNYLNGMFSPISPWNYAQTNDTQLTLWMEEALGEINETARKYLYYKIQERLIEVIYPQLWVMTDKDIYIYVSNLKGLQHKPFKLVLKNVYFA
ncbi:MAG: ABC transporter substrate-binding protein [Candidatus Thorarchaeota archaeon]